MFLKIIMRWAWECISGGSPQWKGVCYLGSQHPRWQGGHKFKTILSYTGSLRSAWLQKTVYGGPEMETRTSHTAQQVKAAHCTSLWCMSGPQRLRQREKTNIYELHMYCPLPNNNRKKKVCGLDFSQLSTHSESSEKEESPIEKCLQPGLWTNRGFFLFWLWLIWKEPALPWVSDPREL